jgi:MSHA biogenesis protein MshG
MCGVVAKHYERDTSIISKNMATLIEPLLIVVIAGVVLTVAMGIFLPMWDMLKLMG